MRFCPAGLCQAVGSVEGRPNCGASLADAAPGVAAFFFGGSIFSRIVHRTTSGKALPKIAASGTSTKHASITKARKATTVEDSMWMPSDMGREASQKRRDHTGDRENSTTSVR